MSESIHWATIGRITSCGLLFENAPITNPNADYVTCRKCLEPYRDCADVKARLAELDRAEQTTIAGRHISLSHPLSPYNIKIDLGEFGGRAYPSKPITTAEINAVAQNIRDVAKPITAPDPRNALLLRAASFIADLPSGSLDRARNVEAMAIRRAIADAVVPKDKPR